MGVLGGMAAATEVVVRVLVATEGWTAVATMEVAAKVVATAVEARTEA